MLRYLAVAYCSAQVLTRAMQGGNNNEGGDSPPPEKAQEENFLKQQLEDLLMDHNRDTGFHWMEGDPPRLSDTDVNMSLESLMGKLFVIPLNTPATKTQPHLTQKRIGEAKSQGYRVPGFAAGGKASGSKQKGGGKDSKKGNASGISKFNKMMGQATSFLGSIGKKTMKPVMNAAKSVYRAPGWMGFAQVVVSETSIRTVKFLDLR